ncbi:uncharacterized protein LOC129743875 [Uranotaenia lowii]|uniref:uncharacterized protein LOC129743875 n=1 Tax=Uranotaenia lowii TaxID=190385 RepID=UPI002479725C|nr:uncharacterized protein LOC129743875 [Uranotaenia lowii]XP_055592075.1 uncharacterized protein LOC129743875 [Uranotaenia lowii]XP_055592076.1 uncharacterized protein LOC129743875 [Uranotaenia lowii]XP_055592077.1 uncharacterized protein LOC129743875 [Uranotaenia lowii]XP_055592078.1 uncharacterized protein LOC129743875 [Uranotaenia lowii]XP_055592079.1 uncharacterized protein LOC129743875 [Uranotaenia lowii]XP_055592080.1 uncharacterized protein LOC129743875 [Uranotaenia lowii]
MRNRLEVLHVAFLLLTVSSQTVLIMASRATYNAPRERGVAIGTALGVEGGRNHPLQCPRLRSGGETEAEQEQQLLSINEWSSTVPAIDLEEEKLMNMVENVSRIRYVIHLAETSPLSIVIIPSCTPNLTEGIRWTVVYNEREILSSHNTRNRTSFQLSCAPSGSYHVWIELPDSFCSAEISYNTRSLTDMWPLLNRTGSPIKFHQHPRRNQLLVKWEKSKFDIHAMHYCLVISRIGPQHTLCQALVNSQLSTRCSSSITETLQRITVEEEKKVNPEAKITIACTGMRTKQLLKGMKANTTYFVEIFAVHTHEHNLSYLLASTVITVNRTRPTQLVEGNFFVSKLSTLGGLTMFSFKVPKRAPSNATIKFLITPCGGTVNFEIYRKKRMLQKPTMDIYYPKIITVNSAIPGERYQVQITEADEHYRTNRIQMAVTTKEEFSNLPQLPNNTTVVELTEMRTCHGTTIKWYGSPDKRKIRYCTYIFKQHTKHHYYTNIRMPSYCELESRDIYFHPQLQQMHCIFSDQLNSTSLTPMSMSITNLAPAHYYLIFVTASLGNGRSIPYRSARIKTHPYCRENDTLVTKEQQKLQQKQQQQQRLRSISVHRKQQQQQHQRGGGKFGQQKAPLERRNSNRLKRDQ